MSEINAAAGQFESKKDAGKTPRDTLARWLVELELADKAEEEWRKAAEDVEARARDEKYKGRGNVRYNIVASNVRTLEPALYAQSPRPDIRPRYETQDPVAAKVASVLEKAVVYHLDAYDFDGIMKAAVHDVLVPGRAVTRVRYKPVMKTVTPDPVPVLPGPVNPATPTDEPGYVRADNGAAVDKYDTAEDGSLYVQDEDYERKVYEETCFEHVHWDDYRRGPGRCRSEVSWEAFRHKFTREQCVEKFGAKIGGDIELDYEPDGVGRRKTKGSDQDAFKRAVVWEIWDKSTRKVIWIAPSHSDGPAKIEDDPLELEGFFSTAAPLYANYDPSNLVPVEDYRIYRSQAEELDIITKRISIITAGLKFRGGYDATMKGLKDIMAGEDNDFLPVENAITLAQNGGLDKALFFLPIEKAAIVLQQLYRQRGEVKQEIFELSGVADIMRGASNANETLGAQKIKAQWGTQRLQERQRSVQRYARDLIRLMVEVIAEKYSPMTLKLMTGFEVTPEMEAMMRLDGPRGFRIDIETDSTIAVDTEAEQANLAELTTGLGRLMQALGPMVQGGAMPIDAAKTLTMSIVRRFKLGREVEDALDQAAQQGRQQPGQPQQPSPEQQAAQAQQQQAQAERQKQDMDMRAAAAESQARTAKANADAAAAQQKAVADQAKHVAEMQRLQNEASASAAEHELKMTEIAHKRAELAAAAVVSVTQVAA